MTQAAPLTIAPELYHADKLDEQPTLSASIAHTLITQSPKHAWTQHPRLNPDFQRPEEQRFDVGRVVHSILLEGADIVHVCHYPDWRSNAAKEARDEARASGRVPLLAHQLEDVQAMVAAAAEQLNALTLDPPMFGTGKPEQTIVWEEGGVHCRARLDWLHDDYSAIEDIKTTSRSAEPGAFSRALYGLGYDTKAAFYLRGVKAVTGAEPTFRWLVIETAAPFALSVVTPGPDVLALGDAKVEKALALWAQCMETDTWPGYPTQVATAELPAWEEVRFLEREAREAA